MTNHLCRYCTRPATTSVVVGTREVEADRLVRLCADHVERAL